MDCYTGDCPNGAVCQSGGTLALDVAKLWRALAKHTSFLTMIGDRGPWTLYEQTTPPKAYGNGLFPWGHNYSYYPGLDGDKNGFSTLPNDPAHDCNNDPPNGPPNGAPCWVAQATRAGRRLIATALQAGGFTAGTNDLAGMFRYGFSYALMPVRLVDSGKQMTEAVNQHKLACSEGMCFSAYTTADGQLKLVLWGIDLDKLASVTVAPGPDQAGGVTDFDVAYHNFSIVLGSIVGGNVKLSSWQLGSAAVNPLLKNVQVKFMGDSGSLAGTGNTIRLLSLEDDVLVSIVADAIGIIRLTTWKVGSNGTFTRLQDTGLTTTQAKEYAVQGGIVPAWALAGPLPKNYQVVVATVTPTNTLRLNSWLVQPSNGSILFQNSATTSPETIRNVSIATDGGGKFATYLTKGTSPSGTHEITFWDVNADGTFSLVQQSNQGGDLAQETGIAPLGPKGFLPGKGFSPSAFLTGLQQGGELKLIAWDLPKFLNEGNAADYRVADSGMVGGPVSQLRMAEMANPTPGDERYVTALKQEDGTLKLIGWSLGKTIGWTIEEPTPVNPTCTAYENQLADLESELQSNGDLMPSADPGLRHWLAHENLQLVQKIKKLKAKVSSCPP